MALEDIRNFRIEKLKKLKEAGILAYPIESQKDADIADILKKWGTFAKKKKETCLAGRIMALRGQGALIFVDLDDGTGKIQALLKRDVVGEASTRLFEETADLGDFVEITGTFFVTKRGEKTIEVKKWKMLAKSLRPLPEKWEGLKDPEEQMRRRYLHLLSDPSAKERFIKRSKLISEIRNFLDKDGYLEVETPILQTLYGGASAMPFTTRYNALNTDFYLRISPELYLKRLLIAGFPKVYELNRNFRNEGIDVTHSPEFTMLEFYAAYKTAADQRNFVEKLIKALVKKTEGQPSFKNSGETIDVSRKFVVVSYYDLFKKYAGVLQPEKLSQNEAMIEAERLGIKIETGDNLPKILDNIYKKMCRPKLIQPTFVTDFPVEYLPLAKRKEDDPSLVDAFQLIIAGVEIVKAFSELNDPLDQRERFENQEKSKKLGDKEAQSLDEDFIEAMEHGMPPSAGVGIGIDRLFMLLSDTHNIRDVILFPTLKPKN
ncbi:MAG: lysine--tRNA ligase [bacterium]|nr:lysine--tRNA ligase [bacterium]